MPPRATGTGSGCGDDPRRSRARRGSSRKQTSGYAADTARIQLVVTEDQADDWADEAAAAGYSSRNKYLLDLIQEARAYREHDIGGPRHADRAELVIRFLFDTGCRLSEMRAVTLDDIDFDRDDVAAAIHISKKKTRKGKIEFPKSEAGNRTVELTRESADMLRDWIAENVVAADEEIFPHTAKMYQGDVKGAFTAAEPWINDGPNADAYKVSRGKSFVSCHWLWHNRNTRIKKEHGPVAAQPYMGHDDTDMTDHYTHYDPDEVQGIVGRD